MSAMTSPEKCLSQCEYVESFVWAFFDLSPRRGALRHRHMLTPRIRRADSKPEAVMRGTSPLGEVDAPEESGYDAPLSCASGEGRYATTVTTERA